MDIRVIIGEFILYYTCPRASYTYTVNCHRGLGGFRIGDGLRLLIALLLSALSESSLRLAAARQYESSTYKCSDARPGLISLRAYSEVITIIFEMYYTRLKVSVFSDVEKVVCYWEEKCRSCTRISIYAIQ